MRSETELSDKEWRQMRRKMSKLDFEPVPETPALLSRSLYSESDEELAFMSGQDEKLDEVRENPLVGGGVMRNLHDSPKNRRSTTMSDTRLTEQRQTQSEMTAMKDSAELPSTSMALSSLIKSRYEPLEQQRTPKSKLEPDDAELAALDAQMAAAQSATRRMIMRAFLDFKAKKARSEDLERTKLSAAHSNDVNILQSKVEDLIRQIARAEKQREQRNLLLDRFSEYTVKQSHLNQERWSGQRSLVACFHAWNEMVRQRVAKCNALRSVLAQSCKRQKLVSFCNWKKGAQGFLRQKQLQEQRDRYEYRIVEMAREYQLNIQQLQQEIEDAKSQVAESQKCRQKLEEDLRLIFLRGVSAMNIEALTAFGSSHKQNRKLGEQELVALPPRQQEGISNQIDELVKTNHMNSSELGVPEVSVKPNETTPIMSLRKSLPTPVAVKASATEHPTPPLSRVSVVRSSYSPVPPYLNRSANGWSHSSNTSGLRSAEMIRQHELSTSSRSAPATYRPSSAPSPTKKRSNSQLSTKYQVEMQYMRSTVAASATRATCTRPVSATRSPASSARSRRS